MNTIRCSLNMPSPVGELCLVGDDRFLTAIVFGHGEDAPSPVLYEAKRQLEEYFAGERREFDLPLQPEGTEFQKKVWAALTLIPYGETACYKDIAARIGNEKACRAVGMANNRNKIPIVIPCHRVIGADGSLVGYGGGLKIKEKLLELESSARER